MINIMNACQSKDPKRHDIIKEYADYMHEKHISEILT